jgi:hypothetical protein
MSIKPYKLDENNELEILSTIAGTLVLFWAILFLNEDDYVSGFTFLIATILFFYNIYFLVIWSYYFMKSWNIKNEKFNNFLNAFGMVLRRNRTKILFVEPDQVEELNHIPRNNNDSGLTKSNFLFFLYNKIILSLSNALFYRWKEEK